MRINLPRRAPQHQTNTSIPRSPNSLETPQNMNPIIRQNNPRPRRILNGIPRPPILSRQSSNSATEVITLERLDVFDLECINEDVVEPQKSNCIVCLEAESECPDHICSLLDEADVWRVR